VRCLWPPGSGGGGAPTGADPASPLAARPPFPAVDDSERWRHPGPPLASPTDTPSSDSSSSSRAHVGANYRETMREGRHSTAAGRVPLRDVVVCIWLVFADAPRQAAGDSLSSKYYSENIEPPERVTYIGGRRRLGGGSFDL
jgi:hypothetical protein